MQICNLESAILNQIRYAAWHALHESLTFFARFFSSAADWPLEAALSLTAFAAVSAAAMSPFLIASAIFRTLALTSQRSAALPCSDHSIKPAMDNVTNPAGRKYLFMRFSKLVQNKQPIHP